MSKPIRRATRSYRCGRCGFTATYPNAGARQARAWFDKHSCRKTEEAAVRAHLADIKWSSVDRTPKPCLHKKANHQHGTRACYVLDRCRCEPCSKATSDAENERRRIKAYGRYAKYVDADPVRLHVRELMDSGIGLKQIVKLGAASQGTLWKLMYGKTQADGTRTPSRRVLRTTAERLYALEPDPANLAGGALIDQTGTARRLQALVAIGYSQRTLATRLGITHDGNFLPLVHGSRRVTKATAEKVAALYGELSMLPVVGHDWHTRSSASLARRRARDLGWLPPLAWDDDLIDQPEDDIQEEVAMSTINIDRVVVDRLLAGDWALARQANRDERLQVINTWQQQGRSLNELERLTGWNVHRYTQPTEKEPA